MARRYSVIVLRFVFAALSLAGIVTQLVIAVQIHFNLVSFFSYFTNLANLFASIVFIVGAVRLARGRTATDLDVAIRAASVVYWSSLAWSSTRSWSARTSAACCRG